MRGGVAGRGKEVWKVREYSVWRSDTVGEWRTCVARPKGRNTSLRERDVSRGMTMEDGEVWYGGMSIIGRRSGDVAETQLSAVNNRSQK